MDEGNIDREIADDARAAGSSRQILKVIGQDIDDLTEAQRHDRQIVPAQAQRRQTQQHARGHRDQDGDGDREEGIEMKGWLDG